MCGLAYPHRYEDWTDGWDDEYATRYEELSAGEYSGVLGSARAKEAAINRAIEKDWRFFPKENHSWADSVSITYGPCHAPRAVWGWGFSKQGVLVRSPWSVRCQRVFFQAGSTCRTCSRGRCSRCVVCCCFFWGVGADWD